MAVVEWRDEMVGDAPDLVETEWDATIDRRLGEVMSGTAKLVDHSESMRLARERLAQRSQRRAVA